MNNLKDDFYTAINYNWIKNKKINDNKAKISNFTILQEKNNKIIKKLILKNKLFKQIYKLTINKKKFDVILPLIDIIKNNDFETLLANFTKIGIDHIFDIKVEENIFNINQNILYFDEPSLSLNKKMYNDKETYNKYKNYVYNISNILKSYNIIIDVKGILEYEKDINKMLKNLEERRDINTYYNLLTFTELKKICKFDLDKYLSKILPNVKIHNIIIGNKNYFTHIKDTNIIKDYLIFRLIDNCGVFISDKLQKNNFNFYGKVLSGLKKDKSKTKKGISLISNIFYDLLGVEYAKKYFSQQSKKYIIHMIKNIKLVMAERIKNLDWMSEDTKKKALQKLMSIKYKVGYPNKIINYSKLIITDNIFTLLLNINKFLINKNFKQLFKSPDKNHWSMGAHEINAYYSPIQNEIVFPAGILQPPFFDINKSNAYNYATIGFVIGHEICHGFDDQGRMFDDKGNLKNWWNNKDEKKYKQKIILLQKQYDKIKLDNNKINGLLTLGENIADLCGITLAFNALKKCNPNLTLDEQKEFFISFAKIWRQKIRPKELSRLIKSDVHSPGILRVNQVLKNIDEFYETFNITKNDKMYIKPYKRIKIF
jgi:putative endopeptidase